MSSSSVKPPVITAEDMIDFNQTPSYTQFLVHSYNYFALNINGFRNYSLTEDLTRDFKLCYERITLLDISLILSLAVVWTLTRFLATRYVFRVSSTFVFSAQFSQLLRVK